MGAALHSVRTIFASFAHVSEDRGPSLDGVDGRAFCTLAEGVRTHPVPLALAVAVAVVLVLVLVQSCALALGTGHCDAWSRQSQRPTAGRFLAGPASYNRYYIIAYHTAIIIIIILFDFYTRAFFFIVIITRVGPPHPHEELE